MNHEAALYEKALRKQLHCTGNTKKYLLQQFRSSLSTYLDEHPSPTRADLQDAFGPPEDMAKVLMENVSEAEVKTYRKRTLFLKIITVVLLAIILIQVIYSAFFKDYTLVTDDSIIIEPAVTSPKGER